MSTHTQAQLEVGPTTRLKYPTTKVKQQDSEELAMERGEEWVRRIEEEEAREQEAE